MNCYHGLPIGGGCSGCDMENLTITESGKPLARKCVGCGTVGFGIFCDKCCQNPFKVKKFTMYTSERHGTNFNSLRQVAEDTLVYRLEKHWENYSHSQADRDKAIFMIRDSKEIVFETLQAYMDAVRGLDE